ncbi:helix-turn-helix domain-containing protein [Aeromicrobium sp. CF3.5]|uniref:helix-turn-helix domain-containing protein n=1 Tax=Aeromicrobium sp. CF3.5 TaxID=3373078 RepID=UPI003EE4A38C
MSDRAHFDAEGFFRALDGVRISRGVNWKQVASAANISQSTLTRLAQGKRPDVDSLAALLGWADLDANAFVGRQTTTAPDPEPLAMISTYLRADRSLSPEAADAIDRVVKATYEALRHS